jgi:hypothetical protein
MMEAAGTSQTLVNIYETTRRNIPEDSHLHTHRHGNLKARRMLGVLVLRSLELVKQC